MASVKTRRQLRSSSAGTDVFDSSFKSSTCSSPAENLGKTIKPHTFQDYSETPGKNIVKEIKDQLATGDVDTVCAYKRVTPVLAQLKNGSTGRSLEDVRKTLLQKHQEAKDRVDSLCVGGGISIWPNMNDMRLTKQDIANLVTAAVALCLSTVFLFDVLHGQLLSDLRSHLSTVNDVMRNSPLVTERDNASFVDSVHQWHSRHKKLVDHVHSSFDVSIYEAPSSYKIGVVVYVVSIGLLLYYLADNVLAKSRLTPGRIKQWLLLLVVSATWTLLGIRLFIAAQQLESAVKRNVYIYNEYLGDLICLRFDLSTYHDVLTYWRTRCLLATSPPLLSIMGLLAVTDINYYLQYYSLPIVSALVLPVVRLAWALVEIYKPPLHVK